MKTSDFNFELPQELIAQTPIPRRMPPACWCWTKDTGAWEHRHFYDLPDYLRPGDCLILNNSRVLPARLLGHRLPGGGACEILLPLTGGENTWECLVRPGKKLRTGARVSFGDGRSPPRSPKSCPAATGWCISSTRAFFWRCWTDWGGNAPAPLHQGGAAGPGALPDRLLQGQRLGGGPTAGLHFTPELLERVQAMGVKVGYVTLHVGLGTFRPVKEDTIEGHEMHSEYCVIPQETADLINETKRSGGRVICVGTTSCRTVESWAAEDGTMTASAGWTDIFIYPGYRFKGAGRADHQFSSARVHACHAGVGAGGTRARSGGLRGGCPAALPVLQLWRRHVHRQRCGAAGVSISPLIRIKNLPSIEGRFFVSVYLVIRRASM